MAEKTFHSITLPGQDTARVPLTAAEFSTSVAYKVKDYCTHQGKLYRCTTAHAAGIWNDEHFTPTDIDAEFDRKLDIPTSQASAPANPRVGDLWIDADENSPIYNVDVSPTLGSTNAVQSGGTKVALNSLDSRKMEHGVITGDFSESVDYRVGDLVFNTVTDNGITRRTLYRCTTDHDSTGWNPAHFTETTLEVELQKIRDSEVNADMIGDLFGAKSIYAVGDYCVYEDALYRCIKAIDNTNITVSVFNKKDWIQVKLANDVSELKKDIDDIDDLKNDVDDLKNDVDDLKNDIDNIDDLENLLVIKNNIDSYFWHIGYWASVTGIGNSNNIKYIRSNQIIDNTIYDIECSDDYKMFLLAYNEHNYVGEWDGTIFRIPPSTSAAISDAQIYYNIQKFREQYPSYIFRITITRTDGADIDFNDARAAIFVRRMTQSINENKIDIINGKLALPKFWQNGSIATNGNTDWPDNHYSRVSTIYYLKFISPVAIIPKTGIQFSVSVYDNNKTFESISQDWLDNTYIFDNPNKLYRISLKSENDIDELYPSQIDNYIESYLYDMASIDDIEVFNKNNVSDIGRLLIPCDNTKLSSQYLISKKNGSIIDFTLYAVGTWRFSIYDQYAAATVNPTYNSRPTWYHEKCDKFILGHTYYFDYKQIDGSLNEINRVYYDLRTISGDIIQVDIKSTWECNFIPEMIAFCLKNSALETATIELVIYDITEIKAFPVISDAEIKTKKIEDFINNKIELFENTQTWKVGIITADAKIKVGNGAIPNARKLDEYSKVILADGCSVICFYFSDEYLGKIAADNSINKISGDWGYFRGEFDPHDYAPSDAKYFLIVVCPEDGTTLTDNNIIEWANAHCTFITYKSVKNENYLQSQINKLSNVSVITDYTPKYVNYDYDEVIISMGQPTLTTGDVLSVSRNGTRVIINGTSGDSNTYIKLSGNFTKVTEMASLTDGIALENGHTYRVSWKLISGTVTIPEGRVYPYISVFPIESNVTIGRPTYGLNGYRDFTYTGTEVNLGMFVQKGSLVFSNAEYNITLEDLSARYNIADYYVTELLDTVTKVRALNDEPSLVFPLITDIHRYSIDWQNFNRSIENMIAFNKYVKCDFIINLGDTMDGNISMNDSLTLAYNTTEQFLNTGIPYYFVNGNHDTNYKHSEVFDIKQNYKALFTATKNVVINPETYGTDYYVDFNGIGVRLICLNACNVMVQIPYAYGSSTAEWLANALDPKYKIILCEHLSSIASQDYNNKAPANNEAITSVIQSFVNNGGSLVQFTGHTHADIAFVSPWISIVQAAARLATVPVSDAGIQKITGYIDTISAETRTPFTVSEDLWSICIYKPISNVVHTIRFGSGKDRHFHVTPIEPQTVSTILDGTITWSSSDTSVATVNNGVISRVGTGTCAILAKDAIGNYECWTVKII